MAAHFFAVLFFFEDPVFPIVIDTLVFYILFGVLSIGCFNFIRYVNLPEKPALSTLFNLLAAVVVCTLVWYLFGNTILKIIYSNDQGYLDFNKAFQYARGLEGLVLFTIMVTLFLVMRYQERIGLAQVEEANLKTLVSESRIQALNSQINPHFLFNSLNSISAQTLLNPEKAREMLSGLSDYLRYTIESKDQALVPFQKELENALRYMEIEGIRFGKRLVFNFEVSQGSKSFKVPRMLLQPLMENIIKHAVENSTQQIGAQLKVSAVEQGFTMLLENDLPEGSSENQGSGIGLKNIEERLALSFGQNFSFNADELDGKFKVFLNIRAAS